ncbi:hypothetical protein HKX41_04405 [Salinisphaera sp. USBA-960]|nr:hypothetical protein [Salifodinibacter halophilus]
MQLRANHGIQRQRFAPSRSTSVVDGEPTDFCGVLPGGNQAERLGVVIHEACGGVGRPLDSSGGPTFYEYQRAQSPDLFVYPDYYLFHVGRRFGNDAILDIFPGQKEVVVPNNTTAIMQAINDRRVTQLLFPDMAYKTLDIDRVTRGNIHVARVLIYSASGRVIDPNVWITGNQTTELCRQCA